MFFTSLRLNVAFVTFVAVLYLAVSLIVGDGLDLEAREEKALFVRIAVMYAVVAAVNLVFRSSGAVGGCGGTGTGPAKGADRHLPVHSRHDGPVRLHDRPGDRRGKGTGRRLQRGAHGPAGSDLRAVEDRHLAAEAPDRHGRHLRRPGVGPHPGLPRLNIHASHRGSG